MTFTFAIPRFFFHSFTHRNKIVESKGITQIFLPYVDTWLQNFKLSRLSLLLKYILPLTKKGHKDTETQGITDEERKKTLFTFSTKGMCE